MIVASGRSALTFNAAMSASSASTTIRSALPLILSPTVNCHDIFGLPLNTERVRLADRRARHMHSLLWSTDRIRLDDTMLRTATGRYRSVPPPRPFRQDRELPKTRHGSARHAIHLERVNLTGGERRPWALQVHGLEGHVTLLDISRDGVDDGVASGNGGGDRGFPVGMPDRDAHGCPFGRQVLHEFAGREIPCRRTQPP